MVAYLQVRWSMGRILLLISCMFALTWQRLNWWTGKLSHGSLLYMIQFINLTETRWSGIEEKENTCFFYHPFDECFYFATVSSTAFYKLFFIIHFLIFLIHSYFIHRNLERELKKEKKLVVYHPFDDFYLGKFLQQLSANYFSPNKTMKVTYCNSLCLACLSTCLHYCSPSTWLFANIPRD